MENTHFFTWGPNCEMISLIELEIYLLWSKLKALYVISASLHNLQISVPVEAATFAENDWPFI